MSEQHMPRFRQELNDAIVSFTRNYKEEMEEIAEIRKNNVTGYLDSRRDQLMETVNNGKRRAAERIEKAYSDYLERLDAAYSVSGNRVDVNILATLDPNKVLYTQEEFNSLVDQFKGNHTMEAALRTYAERAELLCPDFGPSKSEKEQIAERVAKYALGAIPDETSYSPSLWVSCMAGAMFNEANVLTE